MIFFPFFEKNTRALLEIRTKKYADTKFVKTKPYKKTASLRLVFTPDKIARALENKAPDINKRLQAILDLQKAGWQIGFAF